MRLNPPSKITNSKMRNNSSQNTFNNSISVTYNNNYNSYNNNTQNIASIGILDLTFTLCLTQTKAKQLHFNINDYSSFNDLEQAFYHSNINSNNNDIEEELLLDYVTLSSNNILLSSLLYLNRCSTIRFFIEFITVNDFELTTEQLWFKSFLQDVTEKNFLFLMQYDINKNIQSHFEFVLKIIDDETPNNKVIHYKKFHFIPNSKENDSYNINNNSISNTNEDLFYLFMNFNFNKLNYFICDCSQLIQFKNRDYEEITLFISVLTSKNQNIKIITILTDEFLLNLAPDTQLFDTIKEIINLTDIIISEQSGLHKFYSNYNELYEIPWNQRDICILSDMDKKRKAINRITTLINYPSNVIAINQKGMYMYLEERKEYNLNLVNTEDNNEKQEEEEMLNNNKNLFISFYVGAFLNRILTHKSLYSSVIAGTILMKKMLDVIKYDLADTITDLSFYQIIVPKIRVASFRENTFRKKNRLNLILEAKEKGFILDCTNKELSQKKDYNSLYDSHCSTFFDSKNTQKLLKKQQLYTTNKFKLATNHNTITYNLYNNTLGGFVRNNRNKSQLVSFNKRKRKSLFIDTQYK